MVKIEEYIRDMCDKRIPMALRGRVYHIVIRPALLHGSEWWPQKKTISEFDSNRSEDDSVGKIKETRLRWFGHVKRSNVEARVRRCKIIYLPDYRKGKGQPKKN